MTRVVVTGSGGYIGRVLVPMLADEHYDVVERDLGIYSACTYPAGGSPRARWDAREAAPADFEGARVVVHLAALSNDPLGDLDPELTYAINHAGTVRVAEAARTAGVERLLFASSCSLYGSGDSGALLDETAPLAPITPYAETKVTAEAALSAMASDSFSPVYLRNATVYGPSPALRLDIVVNDLCATAATTGKVKLLSDGRAWRPQVHVTDVARAVIAAIEAPTEVIHDQAFNVGRADDNLTVLEIAEMVAGSVPGGAAIEVASGASSDSRSYRVDFAKIEDLLPTFRPKWTVAEGIPELLELFLSDAVTEADFARYRRLAEIRRLLDAGQLTEDLRWL